MKKYIFIFTAFLILIISNVLIIKRNRTLKQNIERLENNNKALIKENEAYTGTIREMTLTIDEFKENFPKLQEELKKEKIKAKYLKDMTITNTETIIEKKVPVYDTVYIEKNKDKGKDTSKALIFNYTDHWNTINGKIINDSIDISYRGKDTLDMIAYRVPKRFLFFKHGTKYIEVKTSNRNPYIEVTGQRRIAITKNRPKRKN